MLVVVYWHCIGLGDTYTLDSFGDFYFRGKKTHGAAKE
jgi:hypothetical protein